MNLKILNILIKEDLVLYIYTATWSDNKSMLVLKSLNNSNEDLSEILNEVIIYFIFNLIIIYLLIFIYL